MLGNHFNQCSHDFIEVDHTGNFEIIVDEKVVSSEIAIREAERTSPATTVLAI
jgi:hypothetical protein